MGGMNVVLMAATPGAKAPVELGSTRSGRGGEFELHYRGNEAASVKYLLATRPGGAAEAGFPVDGQSYRARRWRSATARPAGRCEVTERTTVAMGFAMAQFIGAGDQVAGKNPGLKNAAAMSADLVDRHRRPQQGPAQVPQRRLDLHPADLQLARQPADDLPPPGHRLRAAAVEDAARPAARPPATRSKPSPTSPATPGTASATSTSSRSRAPASAAPGSPPSAAAKRPTPGPWRCASKARRPGIDGPGNFSIDPEGNLWVANNYAYSRKSRQPACGSDKLFRFTPTGADLPRLPIRRRRPQRGRLRRRGRPLRTRLGGQLRLRRQGLQDRGEPHLGLALQHRGRNALAGRRLGSRQDQLAAGDRRRPAAKTSGSPTAATTASPGSTAKPSRARPKARRRPRSTSPAPRSPRARAPPSNAPSPTRSTPAGTSTSPATRATRSPSWRRTATPSGCTPAAACTCRWASSSTATATPGSRTRSGSWRRARACGPRKKSAKASRRAAATSP